MNDNLSTIPYIIRLGKKSSWIIKFNIILAILIKFIVLILATLGLSNLSLAIFADVGVTVFVIINGLRLFGFKADIKKYALAISVMPDHIFHVPGDHKTFLGHKIDDIWSRPVL